MSATGSIAERQQSASAPAIADIAIQSSQCRLLVKPVICNSILEGQKSPICSHFRLGGAPLRVDPHRYVRKPTPSTAHNRMPRGSVGPIWRIWGVPPG